MAYAANVGGTGSMIGTSSMLILKGQADEYVILLAEKVNTGDYSADSSNRSIYILSGDMEYYTKIVYFRLWAENGLGESPITFANWFVIGLPVATINLFVVWAWLEIYFLGFRYRSI